MNNRSQRARRSEWFFCSQCLAVVLVAFGVVSCGGGSDGSGPPPSPGFLVGGEPPAAVCGGADLSNLTSAVYVSTAGIDGAGCGLTTKTACQTLQQGIQNCAASGCGVIVRHGLYPTSATIVLRDGVDVYGGCRFDGEPDRRYRTVIRASPPPGTPAVRAAGIGAPTTVHGLVVIGKDETFDGTSSITMAVSDSTGLTLTSTVLSAGKGGDGASGQTPRAVNGNQGGAPSLSFGVGVWSGVGGVGGPQCSYGGVSAGAGGHGADYNRIVSSGCFGVCTCTPIGGTHGLPGEQGSLAGIGGTGGPVGPNGDRCGDVPAGSKAGAGLAGIAGSAADCGSTFADPNANVWGQLTRTIWLPSSGGDGGLGDWGGGGGGGGAGGACTHTFDPNRGQNNTTDFFGSPGGGGGSGGCGGPGGKGGQQGGASIALILDNAVLPALADQNAVVAGLGGRGGTGGQGSAGGAGGDGGEPDANRFTPACSSASGDEGGFGAIGGTGGKGGQGGAGSGGAGGNGGPSLAVALTRGSAPPAGGAGIYLGTPGLGGAGGLGGVNPSCSATTAYPGLGGAAAGIVSMDSPPANLLVAGQTLPSGLRILSPDGGTAVFLIASHLCVQHAGQEACKQLDFGHSVEVVMQTDGNLCLPLAGCTNTSGHPGAYLAVLDDGTAAIFDGSIKLWTLP